MKFNIKHIKYIKLFIWFLFAILLDTTFSHHLMIFSAKPYFAYTLIAFVALLEEDFSSAMVCAFCVAIVCAALFGQSFAFELVYIVTASVATFFSAKKLRYINDFVSGGLCAAVIVVLHILLSQVINDGIFSLKDFGNAMVFLGIYTFCVAIVLFGAFRKSIYGQEKRKSLF